MNDQFKSRVKALAIYQVIGGVLGLGLTFYFFNPGVSVSLLWLLILPFVLGLYGYSIYCGIILFKDIEKGLKRSKVNQLLQVISFMAAGYGYQYASGFYFSIGIDLTNSFTFNFNFGISSWQLNINTDNPNLILSINIVAIFLVVFIDKAQQKLKSLNSEEQFSFEKDQSSIELQNVQVSDTTEAS
jgi:hypothetical protein